MKKTNSFGMTFPALIYAQTNLNQLKPEAYFDFWVGSWDLTWEATDGTTEKGTNHIEKILNGNVILENFTAETGRFKNYKYKNGISRIYKVDTEEALIPVLK